eukprot:Gb_35841 [translate_table: standard]
MKARRGGPLPLPAVWQTALQFLRVLVHWQVQHQGPAQGTHWDSVSVTVGGGVMGEAKGIPQRSWILVLAIFKHKSASRIGLLIEDGTKPQGKLGLPELIEA